MLALVRTRDAERASDYPGLNDLQELLCRANIQENCRLWFLNSSQLAGYAFNDHYPDFSGISFEYAPQYAEIGGELVEWCLENFRLHHKEQATQIQLSVAPENLGRIELLQAHGFKLEDWSLITMTRPVSDLIPPLELPDGFCIRSFRGEEEMDAWVALHQAAFGTQVLTAEYRRTWMQVPGYNPALDLVAVAPDGTLAAYGFYSVQPEESKQNDMRVGMADSVGTHPAYRRMGLARALLLAGLPILKELGIKAASLTTASYNTAMQQAASSAGFIQTGQILYFAKALHAKEDER